MLAPVGAALAYLGMVAAYIVGATAAFTQSLALPLIEPVLAGFAALAAMVGYRFVVADKEERFLRKSFALYLAPQVIDKMLTSNKMPELGGEMRNVTVFFSDVAGFSSIAEKMTPTALVALMNEYLSAMTDIIEEQRRLRRQVYRRFDRRGVRRAGRRSRSRPQRRARGAAVPRPPRRAQPDSCRVPGLHSWPTASDSIRAMRWSAISARGGASITR